MSLNPWVALVLGILIGWLLQWLLELLFFRKQRLECQDRLAGVEAQLTARETELSEARAHAASLEADLAGARTAAVVPVVEAEAPEVDLSKAAVIAGIGAGVAVVDGELEAEAPEVSVEVPEVENAAPDVEVRPRAVDLGGAALAAEGGAAGGAALAAGLGLGLMALGGEAQAEAPEAPELKVEPAEVDLGEPAVVAGLAGEAPGVAFEAPAIGTGEAAVAVGLGAGLASLGDADEVDTRAAQIDLAASLPTPVARIEPDDLTQVKGIGPKYAAQLNAAGITTYAGLSHTPAERLREIVDAPAWRQVDYPAWIVAARALAEAPRRMVVGDDFTTLEGIGPVYDAKLKHAGIATFAQLAVADEGQLAEIAQAPAWRRVKYGEWIEQAKLAAVGDTAGLKALQAELFSREGDNLGLIAGVGEKNAAALKAAGINSYAALGETTPQQLAEITKAAGVRAGDFDWWIEEAKLRAAGKRIKRATRGAGVSLEQKVSCPQDLSRIKGIGSAYEVKLYEAGIGTYWELSEITDEDVVRVLGVQDFQAVDIVAVKADALKLAEETNSVGRYWDGTPPDDFEKLEGIGEVFERRLYDAGICTFRALAEVSEERLQEICQAPDWRKPDYGAWVEQARRLIG